MWLCAVERLAEVSEMFKVEIKMFLGKISSSFSQSFINRGQLLLLIQLSKFLYIV